MEFHPAACFLLAGFVAFFLPMACTPRVLALSEIDDETKIQQTINKLNLAKWSVFIALFIQAIVIWQGFHLIQSGYDIDLTQADPSAIGRTAARSRGRGGIILLVIQFFPYFLIGGYGFLAWETFQWLGNSRRRIKSLGTVYSFLKESSYTERRELKELVLKVMDENPEHAYEPEWLVGGAVKAMMGWRNTKPVSKGQNDSQGGDQGLVTNKNGESRVNSRSAIESSSLPNAINPKSTSTDEIETELLRVNSLKDKGLITEDEYQALRAKILGL